MAWTDAARQAAIAARQARAGASSKGAPRSRVSSKASSSIGFYGSMDKGPYRRARHLTSGKSSSPLFKLSRPTSGASGVRFKKTKANTGGRRSSIGPLRRFSKGAGGKKYPTKFDAKLLFNRRYSSKKSSPTNATPEQAAALARLRSFSSSS